jgi:hypothetical protein
MPGFNQRARVSGGDDVVEALRGYITNAAALVTDAVREEQEALVERQQQRAQVDDRWSEIADQISSWDDDGDFAYGVQANDNAVALASMLEFGDETHGPSPLIRMGLLSDVSDMRWGLSDAFRRGGY